MQEPTLCLGGHRDTETDSLNEALMSDGTQPEMLTSLTVTLRTKKQDVKFTEFLMLRLANTF